MDIKPFSFSFFHLIATVALKIPSWDLYSIRNWLIVVDTLTNGRAIYVMPSVCLHVYVCEREQI